MGEWFDQAVQQIDAWPRSWAYAALALSAFLENVVPPIPGDTVVVLSAYLAGRGVLSWVPVYAATCLGGTAGFLAVYWVGRSRGRALLQRGVRGFSPQSLGRAQAWLIRFGPWLVLANRFLTGVRSVIALAAGAAGVEWLPVAVLGLASTALWNGVLLYAGMSVGENWEQVTAFLGRYNRVVLGGLAAVLAIAGARRWLHRRRSVDSGQDGQ